MPWLGLKTCFLRLVWDVIACTPPGGDLARDMTEFAESEDIFSTVPAPP